MDNTESRKYAGKLIYAVLTEQRSVLDAVKIFPDTKDSSVECAYHALVHYASDEKMRYQDIEYRDVQDEYLEFIAQTLCEGKALPKNIINEYKPYYKGVAKLWHDGWKWFTEEIKRFINT